MSTISDDRGPAERRRRMLLVEDDADTAEALRGVLEADGYATMSVGSLGAARSALVEVIPDVIVLDMVLPDGSGEDFIRELAARNDAPAAVLVSGASHAADVARRFGVTFVAKPFDREYLLAAVRAAILERNRPSFDGF